METPVDASQAALTPHYPFRRHLKSWYWCCPTPESLGLSTIVGLTLLIHIALVGLVVGVPAILMTSDELSTARDDELTTMGHRAAIEVNATLLEAERASQMLRIKFRTALVSTAYSSSAGWELVEQGCQDAIESSSLYSAAYQTVTGQWLSATRGNAQAGTGSTVASSIRTTQGPMSSRSWYSSTLALPYSDAPQWSALSSDTLSLQGSTPVITASVPVFDADRSSPGGIMAVELALDEVRLRLSSIATSHAESVLVVVDELGQLVASSRTPSIDGPALCSAVSDSLVKAACLAVAPGGSSRLCQKGSTRTMGDCTRCSPC